MSRVGVFGGTFDPPHVGHLGSAANGRHAPRLDPPLLGVGNDPWQKAGTRPISPAADRLAMVDAAIADVDGVEEASIEINGGGTSSTADTLAALREADPSATLFLVLGSDAAAGLPTWERAEEVRGLATVVVVTRPGAEAGAPPDGWRWERVESPRLEVSSTDLRARVADGRPLDYLLTAPVLAVIRAQGLYGGTPGTSGALSAAGC